MLKSVFGLRSRSLLFGGFALIAGIAFAHEIASRDATATPTPSSAAAVKKSSQNQGGALGYYRFPTIHGDTVVFTSEGDLWRVSASGGMAQRLTTHLNAETSAAISPDGKLVAFSASYEGPTEVYTMPIDGGLPTRLTYGRNATVRGWTADGRVIYSTSAESTLPNMQLCVVSPTDRQHRILPLSQASDGSFAEDGRLFFTRFAFQGSHAKRYKGGTAQNIWRWDGDGKEAKPLTADYKGTSRDPMCWNGRIYFESDRDGVMNIWSMNPEGKDLKQHTKHSDYDVQSPSLGTGRIVYQHGADLRVLDLKTGTERLIPIRLASDFDQMRERWVTEPLAWTTAAHISPDGTKIVLTARGQVFVAPVKPGRIVEATRRKSVRYRDARFLADGKSLVALSDESGEVELWKLGILGEADFAPQQLTTDSKILKWQSRPSPDGKWIAHTDKNKCLFLYNTATKANKKVDESEADDIGDLAWSPDGRYLAYVWGPPNTFGQIRIYSVEEGKTHTVTTDRFNDSSPTFSLDGKFLYFLSDRRLRSLVGSPWGTRAPEPFFDKQDQIYFIPLQKGLRSPFQPDDELTVPDTPKKPAEGEKPELPKIDFDGIQDRLQPVPVPSGNYRNLAVCGGRLYLVSSPTPGNGAPAIVSVAIRSQNVQIDPILPGAGSFETTPDGKKILAGLGSNILVFDANGATPNPEESRVDLSGWSFSFDPREEWRQMFDEAWRLHRDYLYDPNMHGVNWPAMKAKYRPLVDRVTDRAELSDLLAQMVGEISILHTNVYGGDIRGAGGSIDAAGLGADWEKDTAAGGYRITRIYRNDPDLPEEMSPLLRSDVMLEVRDVIAQIDGVSTLSVPDAAALLRTKAGKQIRLRVYPAADKTKARDVIVTPLSLGQARNLRYSDWEYSRRKAVEEASKGSIGYLHLRAMGSGDYSQFARDFFPAFDKQGLIIDARHNAGGNIDSWILEKLMRRAWMYWNQHKGMSTWNMQYAFRGHMVVLCNEWTASDGEAFSEGFRRLGLGKVIGTRTWGGEVWLTGSNGLVDNGIATAAEFGVFGPEGQWLIEGHGVEPDIVVDNLPHATYAGKDSQLEAAIKYLQEEIRKNPNPVPATPKFPDKSKGGGGGKGSL
ncbi:MAG: PD40 domain-containing protein [Fimbriimonadaceae bacterium]|nr:PD40 domain-containing protein [Fimbriimonadaceae bacterium]